MLNLWVSCVLGLLVVVCCCRVVVCLLDRVFLWFWYVLCCLVKVIFLCCCLWIRVCLNLVKVFIIDSMRLVIGEFLLVKIRFFFRNLICMLCWVSFCIRWCRLSRLCVRWFMLCIIMVLFLWMKFSSVLSWGCWVFLFEVLLVNILFILVFFSWCFGFWLKLLIWM